MPKLQYSFDVGHVITILILLVSGAVAYGKLSADLIYVKEQIAAIHGLSERVVRVETMIQEEERRRNR